MKFIKFFIIFFAIFFSVKVFAANLDILPISQSVNMGDTVSVSVMVSTSGQVINAVSGVLSFPKDLLEVSSVSATGSIINFWANDPKFSNSEGTVNFEGVIMSPGYSGNNGRVLKINFKIKTTGQADLQFGTASILANDGNGTDITSGKGTATISIKEKIIPLQKVTPIEQKIEPVVETPPPTNLPIPLVKDISIPTQEVQENIPSPERIINTKSTSNTFYLESIYWLFLILGIFIIILLLFIIIYQRFLIKKLRILLKHYDNKKKV